MKTFILSFIFLSFCAVFVNAQENPWLPKGENPWGVYQKKTEKVVTENNSSTELEVNENTLQEEEIVRENNSTATADTANNLYQKKEFVADDLTERELWIEAGKEAYNEYHSGSDFLIGFSFGMVLPTGIVAAATYSTTKNKNEKRVTEKIINDPTYEIVDDRDLKRKVRNSIKGKKLLSAVGGALVGVATKVGVFLLLINA